MRINKGISPQRRGGAEKSNILFMGRVAWMKRSVIRESIAKLKNPDSTSLHPGYSNKTQSLMIVVGAALAANCSQARTAVRG